MAYLRLSETYSLNSDSANILLMGQDLLHGHLLLHGWYMSDVSFYPTELPQYALLESFLGLHMQTAHVAAAMTYTLTFLLAILLARSGSTGRQALIRTLIAAGIMLAPQFGLGVFALDLSVGHIGTSVPLLLTWLLLDKMSTRWYVPVLTAVLLAWALVADPIVYVVGVGPLGAVATARVIRGLVKGTGHWMDRIVAQWYDLSLGAAAVAATVLAWVVNNLLSAMGAYTVNRPPFYLTPWHYLRNNGQATWKVLEIFGANYAGHSGVWLALAFLHMASVLVVLLGPGAGGAAVLQRQPGRSGTRRGHRPQRGALPAHQRRGRGGARGRRHRAVRRGAGGARADPESPGGQGGHRPRW